MFGLLFFYLGKEKNSRYFPISALGFGLSLYSYQSSIIVVPPMIILLCIFYFKDLIKNKKNLIASAFVLALLFLGFILNPRLLGAARVQQNMFSDEMIKATSLFKKTGNKYAGLIQIAAGNYPKYFLHRLHVYQWRSKFSKLCKNFRRIL